MALMDQPLSTNLRGEVIQQLWVRRRFASKTEVRRRRDDAFAKVMLPKAVYHDPRCERMARHL